MKRFLLTFVLLLIFSISSIPLTAFAEVNRAITILYTGSVKGTIDPCAA